MTLNAKIEGLMDFLAILGCGTSLYHSQGGAMALSLCDPDREFRICILIRAVTVDALINALMR